MIFPLSREREREKEREREIERERKTDRERESNRERDRDRERERHRKGCRDWDLNLRHTHCQAGYIRAYVWYRRRPLGQQASQKPKIQ